MQVCLIVLGIVGVYCANDAAPVGDCLVTSDGHICLIEPTALPIWASSYDPALGGINCNGNCDHTATRPVTPDMYDWAAACPAGWTTRGHTTTIITPHRTAWCVDRGGAINPTWRQSWTPDGFRWLWVIVIDFMMNVVEYWHYQIIPAGEWSLGWGQPPGG